MLVLLTKSHVSLAIRGYFSTYMWKTTNLKWSIYGGGRFRELEYHYNGIVWEIVLDRNKAIGIEEWSIYGGGRLERFLLYTWKFANILIAVTLDVGLDTVLHDDAPCASNKICHQYLKREIRIGWGDSSVD